jgi:transposase
MVGAEGLGRAAGAAARRQARQRRAKVALARKLAGVLHRIWVSAADFRYGTPAAAMEA